MSYAICIFKKNYVANTKTLKHALNHGLKLKKVHRVIQFNQKEWLKSYIDMNTKLKREAKIDSEKDFFKPMNNAVVPKSMENIRKHKYIRLVTANKRRSFLM